ncbi:MAG: DUF3568 family protein [Sedimentisphaerales bacterium]|nr:DUF3568 family protein [Sedimentisphaerales bacterium]
MRSRQVLLAIFLICSTIVIAGCASSDGGAKPKGIAPGTAKYSMGTLESFEAKSIDKVYDAALKAMDELKLPVIQKGVDSMSGKIVGRDVADKKIVVTLSSTTDGMTKVSIKVGLLGDEAKSRLVYEQLKKKI